MMDCYNWDKINDTFICLGCGMMVSADGEVLRESDDPQQHATAARVYAERVVEMGSPSDKPGWWPEEWE